MTARQRLPSDREIERVLTKLRALGIQIGAEPTSRSSPAED